MPGDVDINRRIAEARFMPAHPTRRDGDERNDPPPRLIVIHSTEGSEGHNKAVNTGTQFSREKTVTDKGSTQFAVDASEVIRCGEDDWQCNGAKGANHDGLHIEQCGRHDQTEGQWLDEASRATIKNAALVVAFWHLKFGIPVDRFLTADEVADPRARGLTDHNTVREGRKIGTHTDPGLFYPRHVLLADIQEWLGTGGSNDEEDEDMSLIVASPQRPMRTGRTPYVQLNKDGNNVICANGARLVGDKQTGVGFVWDIPIAGPFTGLAALADGSGIIVTSADFGTAVTQWQ